MSCWVEGAAGSPYDVDNLPYGVFSTAERDGPRVGVRIGNFVLDAAPVAAADMLEIAHAFEAPTLNPIMAAAKDGGAAASYLSGGGSTVAAFVQGTDATERVARMMTLTATSHGFSGKSIITAPSSRGVYVAEKS